MSGRGSSLEALFSFLSRPGSVVSKIPWLLFLAEYRCAWGGDMETTLGKAQASGRFTEEERGQYCNQPCQTMGPGVVRYVHPRLCLGKAR